MIVLAGGGAGWALAPPSSTYVGPLEVQIDVVPSLRSGVHVQLPPVGAVDFDTHAAPVAVDISVRSVDLESAQALVGSPQTLLALQVTAPQVLREAVTRATVSAATCAVAGAVTAAALVYRRRRRVLQAAGGASGVVLALAAVTVLTAQPQALQQPRFTGLLSHAPYLAGAGATTLERLESYRAGLADFVQSVTAVYAVAGNLPVLPAQGATTTVLHVSDIHLNPMAYDVIERLVEQFTVSAVVDTGDVTTWGTEIESSLLSRIAELEVPYVFVRGNHDSRATEAAGAAASDSVVLDREVAEVAGLTFAGIGDPQFTPEEGEGAGGQERRDVVGEAVEELRDVIDAYERSSPDDVEVALVHDPSKLDAVLGEVPLVLAGHYHYRVTREDASGTLVMVQGSTGGAGITAAGLDRLGEGEPLALSATLLHFAADGPHEGDLVAYDEVTVGGMGLTSVTVERTVVAGPDEPADESAPPVGAAGTETTVRGVPRATGGYR